LTVPGINAVWYTEVLTNERLVLEYDAYQIETDNAKLNTCVSPGVQIPAEVIQSGDKKCILRSINLLAVFGINNSLNSGR
jgi:hypothetical protein